jgi:Cysteine rich repeat
MRMFQLLAGVWIAIAAQAVLADPSAMDQLRVACAQDAQRLCAGVQPGGGRILACLKAHKDQLSPQCRQAAAPASNQGSTSETTNPAAAPSSVAGSPPAAPATTASPVKAKRAAATPGTYLLLKQVKVIDPGMDKVQAALPAYRLLLPTDWKMTGTIAFGSSQSGCFADLFALVVTATSADGSTKFQTAPDYTWQYADDPAVMKSLRDPNRRSLGASNKPCKVAKPMKAEDYFRQNVLTLFPSGTSVVSVEPFPELNEIVRQRLGLQPGEGTDRTEAIRARLAFNKDGKDQEEWIGLVVETKISSFGHGSFYNSHALSLVALTAPKGKLDANDKLFKVIVSSIQPEPQWVRYSDDQLTKLYQAEARKNAVMDQIYAKLQQQAISDIQEVTANQQRGSNISAMRTDQNIRNVQTYRDPSSGRTMELSNLYDNAWYNKDANQYVMSDDPNFKASGALTGNWTELQVVTPSP